MHLLAPLPLIEPLLQGQGAVEVLSAGAAEQDQRQLGGGQCIGTGVMAVFNLQVEVPDPVVQPRIPHVGVRAQQGRQGRHVHERVL